MHPEGNRQKPIDVEGGSFFTRAGFKLREDILDLGELEESFGVGGFCLATFAGVVLWPVGGALNWCGRLRGNGCRVGDRVTVVLAAVVGGGVGSAAGGVALTAMAGCVAGGRLRWVGGSS